MGRTAAAASVAVGIVTASVQPAHASAPPPDVSDTPLAAPAVAAPAPAVAAGPDAGSVPAARGDLALPGLPQPITAPPQSVVGPLAAEIIALSSAKEAVGEQLLAVNQELADAHTRTASAQAQWDRAAADLAAVRTKADTIASDVYKDATALGPFQSYANDLQVWGLIAPALPLQVGAATRPSDRDSVGYELAEAERVEQAAKAVYDEAKAVEAEVAGRQGVLTEQFARHTTALTTLISRNDSIAVAQAEAQRETWENSLTPATGVATSVNGLASGPRALTALAFALSQLGRPYEWAAEGPFRYDCSGLMFAAYASAGVRIPRVSRDQYRAGTPVLVSQLLPGDLLFFSTDRSDWRKIHHVAMYIGNGQMVHAPTWGQVVKISPIWWSEFFGAARFVPAVGTPTAPRPTPSATPTPTPSATPTPTPSATPTPTPSATPTPTVTPTPSATPTPTPSETPTPTPSETPTPTPTPSATPTPDPTPTPTPTLTATPTVDPSPTTSPSPSALPEALTASPSAPQTLRRLIRRGPRRRLTSR